MRAWSVPLGRIGSVSYSYATDMLQQIVVRHAFVLRLWRCSFELSFKTRAAEAVDREIRDYRALYHEARGIWDDPSDFELVMEDLWAAGGTRITAMALMRRIVAGSFKNPWDRKSED